MKSSTQFVNGIPLTPNIESYKGQCRNKTKKKTTSPNMPALQNLHAPINIQKGPTTPSNLNSKYGSNQNHGDKKSMYFSRDNSKKQLFGMSTVTDAVNESRYEQDQKNLKKKSIEAFQRRVAQIKESIFNREQEMQELLQNESDYFSQCLNLLNSQFTNIIHDIEQKHKELNNSLADSMMKRNQAIEGNFQIMEEIKKSMERYLWDIEKNYNGILEELSIEHFKDIMKQYNAKIQYYKVNILEKLSGDQELKNKINLYIPMQEIRRVIDKANIQFLGGFDNIGSQKSLQKYMSHGNQSLSQNNFKNSKNILNDRKSESKITPIQKKRTNTTNNIHQIRGVNKENINMDFHHNREYSDQYIYYES